MIVEGGVLEAEQIGISAIRLKELVLRAAFEHAAVFQVEDQIGPGRVLQVVSNRKSRTPLGQTFQRFEHGPLIFFIESRGRFIENQDWSMPDGSSGNGNSLA